MQSNAGSQQQAFGFGQPASSNSGLRSTQGNLFSFLPSGSNNAMSTGLGFSPFQNQQQFGQGGGFRLVCLVANHKCHLLELLVKPRITLPVALPQHLVQHR